MDLRGDKAQVLSVLRETYSTAWRQQLSGCEADGFFESAKGLASGAYARGASTVEIVMMLREGARAAEEATGKEIRFGLK